MIRFLEVPDFHFDMIWALTSAECAAAVTQAAADNNVDFITVPGDLFNRHIYNTDDGGINILRQIIKNWSKICPVVAVEGTPSHDGPGCYGPLEDCGIVLLRPGKVYKYWNIGKRGYIGENMETYTEPIPPSALLFGIPELNTRTIVAQLELSAEKANAEAPRQIEQYITEFIAPRRAAFPKVPAVGLLHGVVSDSSKENSIDHAVRASDIVIKTEVLRIAGLTRWSLGHAHSPWESRVISAGYAGFTGVDDTPWNYRDFVPAMNLISADVNEAGQEDGWIVKAVRIPYGTPKRVKIHAPLSVYDAETAYWLETDDLEAVQPAGHPWSRVTHGDPKKEADRRVSKDELSKALTLPDLIKLYDPKAPAGALNKAALIEKTVSRAAPDSINVSVDRVEITGATFWPGTTISFSPSECPQGLTAIVGGNGTGKSSLLAFCTPYPRVVGKDTTSGRASAIKDFFSGPEAQIKKWLTFNGEKHKHIINIRGAHTKDPKVECTLLAGERQLLQLGTFDEMFAACEKLYGPFSDYLLTSFYVQPLQGRTGSSLMSASVTDIRDLVQSIAGIDREAEKEYSLSSLRAVEKDIADKQAWLAAAESMATDADALRRAVAEAKAGKIEVKKKIDAASALLTMARARWNDARENAVKSDADILRKKNSSDRVDEIASALTDLEAKIKTYETIKESSGRLRVLLQELQDNDIVVTKNAKMKNDYDAAVNAWRSDLVDLQDRVRKGNADRARAYQTLVQEYEDAKRNAENLIKGARLEIKANERACPQCGYIDPDAIKKIKDAEKTIEENEAKIAALPQHGQAPDEVPVPTSPGRPAPQPPAYVKEKDVPPGITIAFVVDQLKTATDADSIISGINAEIKALNDERARLKTEQYPAIDLEAWDKVRKAEADESAAAETEKTLLYESAKLDGAITAATTALEQAADNDRRIKETRSKIEEFDRDRLDWAYLSAVFAPQKLPAFELDAVAETIDAAANASIKPYQDGRFWFSTKTQVDGQKNVIDKFSIRVRDAQTGRERDFIFHSPGEKAFLNDAYVKALINVRNDRQHRSYSPIISDEADGPVQPDRVRAFYDMQGAFYEGKETRVLVVSHAPDAHNCIPNHVKILDLIK